MLSRDRLSLDFVFIFLIVFVFDNVPPPIFLIRWFKIFACLNEHQMLGWILSCYYFVLPNSC